MKKSFIYLSSTIFISLFTINSVDAAFSFGKSKNKEPQETVASKTFNEADLGSFVKMGKTEIATLKSYEKALGSLGQEVTKLVSNPSAFSQDHEAALPIIICVPLSNTQIYAKAIIEANTQMDNGISSYSKVKTRSNDKEANGEKLIRLGVSLSEAGPVALAALKANIVIAHKWLKDNKDAESTNSGKVKLSLEKISKILGEKKKMFSKTMAPGEERSEQELLEESKTMEQTMNQRSKLHPLLERYTENLTAWEETIALNKEYLEAAIAFIDGNPEPLQALSAECETAVSGRRKANEAEDDEDSNTRGRNGRFEHAKKPKQSRRAPQRANRH